MKKLLIAAATLVLVAAMCIPITVFSGDSDAASTVTPGSSGISAKMTLEDESEIFKFIDKDDLPDIAMMYLGGVVENPAQYNVSDVKVLKLETKSSKGTEVKEDSCTEVEGSYGAFKMTFTATAKDGALYSLFDNEYGQLIKYVDTENINRAGAVFKIELYSEETDSTVDYYEFVKNADDNLVITHESHEYNHSYHMEYSVKYTYSDADKNEINREFDITRTNDDCGKYSYDYDFMKVEPKDATLLTNVFKKSDIDYGNNYNEVKVKCDGSTYVQNVNNNNVENDFDEYTTADVWAGATVSAPEYTFYGAGPNALYRDYDICDTSLRSNDALKAYLDEHGSTGTDFDAAKSLAESTFDSPAKKSRTLLYVGIGVAVVAVVAIAAVVFLRSRN